MSGQHDGAGGDVGGKVVRAAAWSSAMRWSVRAVGLVNILVLARLLTPEDFGVVALAMIAVALINALNDVGLDLALIRAPRLGRGHYDAAWTLSVLFGAANGLLLFVSAPWLAAFFEDARLLPVMQVVALVPLLDGLANVRTADFRREFRFSLDFAFALFSRLSALPVSIGFALYLGNYWALVLGMVAQSLVTLVVSYAMKPYLPRFSLRRAGQFLRFSLWVQLRSVGQVLGQRIDQFYIGKLFGPVQVGGYNVAQEITEMATTEIVLPLGRALLPGYAQMQGRRERLREAFHKVLALHVALGIALAAGFHAVAEDFVLVVLGEQWVGFGELFRILALAGGLSAIASATWPLLVAIDRVDVLALAVWARFGLSVLALGAVAALGGNMEHMAWARVLVVGLAALVLCGVALSLLGAGLARAARQWARPLLAAIVMVWVVRQVTELDVAWAWLRLAAAVGVGGVVYITVLFVAWRLAGRPAGIEAEVVSRIGAWADRRAG